METEDQNLSKLTVKNSVHALSLCFIIKFGGLFITILIARFLLPELFGIYALAISIIMIATTFTNLGTDDTLLRYLSDAFGKNDKARLSAYFRYLFKIKSFLILIVISVILLSSKFLAYNIYDKPLLFYPLIFSCFYIIVESLKSFFGTFFFADKNIKPLLSLGFLQQIFKILFVLLVVFLLQDEYKISGLFIAFAVAGLIYLFLIILTIYKKNKSLFSIKKVSINKKRINRFLKSMGVVSLSLAFFMSIDILMLGKFVESSYLGYYRVALSLILSITAFFTISSVLLPVFTQIHNKRFERGFQKTFRFLMLLAIPSVVGIVFIARYLIFIIYGSEYLLATSTLYVLSLLIITSPLITLYTAVFESKEKPKIVAKSIFITLIINVILNYALIKYLLNFSQEYVIIGVGISTVISRFGLLGILAINAKQKFNLSAKNIGLKGPIFATAVMGLFLFAFNNFINNMNLFFGAVEIVLGAGIYFGILILTKDLTKEDWKLAKSLIKK